MCVHALTDTCCENLASHFRLVVKEREMPLVKVRTTFFPSPHVTLTVILVRKRKKRRAGEAPTFVFTVVLGWGLGDAET